MTESLYATCLDFILRAWGGPGGFGIGEAHTRLFQKDHSGVVWRTVREGSSGSRESIYWREKLVAWVEEVALGSERR